MGGNRWYNVTLPYDKQTDRTGEGFRCLYRVCRLKNPPAMFLYAQRKTRNNPTIKKAVYVDNVKEYAPGRESNRRRRSLMRKMNTAARWQLRPARKYTSSVRGGDGDARPSSFLTPCPGPPYYEPGVREVRHLCLCFGSVAAAMVAQVANCARSSALLHARCSRNIWICSKHAVQPANNRPAKSSKPHRPHAAPQGRANKKNPQFSAHGSQGTGPAR
jgi:hypothetical protein